MDITNELTHISTDAQQIVENIVSLGMSDIVKLVIIYAKNPNPSSYHISKAEAIAFVDYWQKYIAEKYNALTDDLKGISPIYNITTNTEQIYINLLEIAAILVQKPDKERFKYNKGKK